MGWQDKERNDELDTERRKEMRINLKRLFAAVLIAAVMYSGGMFAETFEAGNVSMVSAAALTHTKATANDLGRRGIYSMKGIQGTEITTGSSPADIQEMGVNHVMLNLDITQVINTDGTGVPYSYNGKTYYFDESEGSVMKVTMARVKEYRQKGVTWTFCLVMSWSDDPVIQKLMYKPEPGKVYYAMNSKDSGSKEHIAAVLNYLADRFSYSDTFVEHWRVGNEVNVAHDFNYTGTYSDSGEMKSTLVDLAVNSYDLLYQALKNNNPLAKAYVSVTHDWNNSNEGKGVPTKDFLDAFGAREKGKDWNLDFHAYPPQMKEQVWTKVSASYLTHEVTTPFICAPNLEVLTDYIKNNFGTNHRIIMSEQSYDSTYGEDEQAAMIAYTYYSGVYNDMVDAVIFTTWQDTNSVYHDYYNMGIIDIYGKKKVSYDVFKYMNTDQRAAYVDPFLDKMSAWTGRTIGAWTDDIIYQAEESNATLSYATLYLPESEQTDKMVMIGMTTEPSVKEEDLEFKWSAYNHVTGETLELSGWIFGNEWLQWYPDENAVYTISCTVRVAGNPSSSMTDSMEVEVNKPGLPDSEAGNDDEPLETGHFATNDDGYSFYRDDAGDVTCLDNNGNKVINGFVCDGVYTYYFQYDGTAMRDRLTYHPDGEHVIYFDKYGHEVFSDFANVRRSISGEAVDDYCFFNVYGYLYVDVVTYDKTGTYLYYANPYGVLERGKWFQFSDTVMCADGTPWNGAAGNYGYANANGTLMVNTYTYDWEGRKCYMQGNGVALYE